MVGQGKHIRAPLADVTNRFHTLSRVMDKTTEDLTESQERGETQQPTHQEDLEWLWTRFQEELNKRDAHHAKEINTLKAAILKLRIELTEAHKGCQPPKGHETHGPPASRAATTTANSEIQKPLKATQ
jgi:hypothetical protein